MLKFFRSSLPLPRTIDISNKCPNVALQNLPKRCLHIKEPKSEIPEPEELPKYEISRDTKEWEFVERLLPQPIIPKLPESGEFPSGWVPPKYNPKAPYVISRTRNGMLPIYLERRFLYCPQSTTVIKRIYGDLNLCAKDIRTYLESFNTRYVHIRVQEVCGKIVIRGDFVMNMKAWALKKKF